MKGVLITGGCGFIGSQLVRDLLQKEHKITVVDSLTYSGDLSRIEIGLNNFNLVDIRNEEKLEVIFSRDKFDTVVHFAAETHVDRSIENSRIFLDTNIFGTYTLLKLAKKYDKKFIYISTDEVYGEIREGKFTEESPLKPNNPYSVSKTAADMLVQSFIRTYNIRANIIRPCNNYGIWQYPEKLIPVVIYKILTEQKIPVYGKGLQIREWLNIQDTIEAIELIIDKAPNGEIYNVGSGHEERNIDVVKRILNILDKSSNLIEFVTDRLGHDFRYSVDTTKIGLLGWKPKVNFYQGLEDTVNWNVENFDWIRSKSC